jgi:hypothetical protein
MSCNTNRPFTKGKYWKDYKVQLQNQKVPNTTSALEKHWKEVGRPRGLVGCPNCCPGDAWVVGEPRPAGSNAQATRAQNMAIRRRQMQQRQQQQQQVAAAAAQKLVNTDQRYSNSISDLEANMYGMDGRLGGGDDLKDETAQLREEVAQLKAQIRDHSQYTGWGQ